MMKRFDVYGSESLSLDEAARLVEVALGVSVEARESSFLGGEYFYFRGSGDPFEELIVQANFEDEDGYLAEADFPSHKTLVYTAQSNDLVDARLRGLDGLSLLRSEVL